ncbi:carbon-nitrogen hydrolase family protein [Paenibacillus thermoaerophilus]|uniref:Carbon-nitrogen hydrolase family protein n=1 Tax=Paenibacillus thermoaerophilus TaxID=1215385 RepID=A0ABW2UZP6_9BACL|nr:carbon-nitrogen hydrolase family protein [Paenibacillus thermoaerophilus]TMV17339.1 carbon-nitrogen hydrolase family protein [Paenibacillus thermoaerophilus]
MKEIKVASVQFKVKALSEEEDFWKLVRKHVDEAKQEGAQLVVFPEYVTANLLHLGGPMSNADACEWLHNRTDQVLTKFAALSRDSGLTILGGTHVHREDGRYYNEAFMFSPDGGIGRQKKLHLTPEEQHHWPLSPGDTYSLFETAIGTVGIQICYDMEFPEGPRLLAEAGADWLLCPSFTETAHGYYRVRNCGRARAVENQVYVVMSGIVGKLPSVLQIEAGYSRAAVFAPSDYPFPANGILAQGRTNTRETVVCGVKADALEENRTKGGVAPFSDRKPELYRASAGQVRRQRL